MTTLSAVQVGTAHLRVAKLTVSVSCRRVPLAFSRSQLMLYVLNTSKLVLQIVDGLSLFDHLMLVIIRLVCNILEQFVNIFLGDGRGLHIINGFARLNPVGHNLALFNLPSVSVLAALLFAAARITQVLLVTDEDDGR